MDDEYDDDTDNPSNLREEEYEVSDEQIKYYMLEFFKGRNSPTGVPLDEDGICTPPNIDIVRSLTVSDAILIAYEALKENRYVGTDFVFCMRLQAECANLRIPKEYSGGLLILYLKVIMGYNL